MKDEKDDEQEKQRKEEERERSKGSKDYREREYKNDVPSRGIDPGTVGSPSSNNYDWEKTDVDPSPPSSDWDSPLEYCFPATTSIAMSDGSMQLIPSIRIDDLVRCWDDRRGILAEGQVVRILTGTADKLIRLNGQLAATPAHRVLTGRGYLRFDEVEVGDTTVCLPGLETKPITQIETLAGEIQVYNLVVAPFSSFFAEGLLVEDQMGDDLAVAV